MNDLFIRIALPKYELEVQPSTSFFSKLSILLSYCQATSSSLNSRHLSLK